jgi:hypothetical protein
LGNRLAVGRAPGVRSGWSKGSDRLRELLGVEQTSETVLDFR